VCKIINIVARRTNANISCFAQAVKGHRAGKDNGSQAEFGYILCRKA